MEKNSFLTEFKKNLEQSLKSRVQLHINDNRSTMLSVKWEPSCTKVSMHRFFLDAPENIMEELACYIKKEHSSLAPTLKSYIEDRVNSLNYTHELSVDDLDLKSNVHNLNFLMEEINQKYFCGELRLNITWFAPKQKRKCSRFTFGLYHHLLRLIKINRRLDRIDVPEYLISYVIYHEMLHHVYPSFCDTNGRRKVHHREFKMMEKKFHVYDKAVAWIEKNRERLL